MATWLAVLSAALPSAYAQDAAAFYRGRSMKIVVGFGPGGGYDIYARLAARVMARHLPGEPSFIVQNMAGAGSRVAANWLYTLAPRDGSVLGMVSQGAPTDQALKEEGIQYKAEEFGWVGNMVLDNIVAISWMASGLTTLEDVKAKGGLVCGGSAGITPAVIYPRMLDALIGANIKIIQGYPGSADYILAIERGEINCIGGNAWSTVKSSMAHFLSGHKVSVLMEAGPARDPDIAAYAGREVPMLIDFAKTELDRKAVELVMSAIVVGRPLFTPPGVPTDRLGTLRKAFDAAMADPATRAEAETLKVNISPVSGAALEKVVHDVTSASPDVVKRVEEWLAPGSGESQKGK
jgi:tripartite-type tricarboxylate transporter receptor subunit TctC